MASDVFLTVDGLDELAVALNATAEEMNLSMDKVVVDVGKEAKRDYRRSTKTWNHQPNFQILTNVTDKSAEVIVGTDDKIFKFIDQGTRVRRALMSPDFVAKTKPGWLGSSGGRGGVVFISKKLSLPGIKARRFTEIVFDRAERLLIKKSSSAVKQAIDRTFHR